MMEHNDELYLKQTVGNRNPFRVPDGYFEQLTEQVMQQLPEREQIVAKQQSIAQPASQPRARKVQMRPWLYAAACTVAAMLMGVTYYLHQDSADDLVADDSYYEEVADYAMIDNMEIYASLEDN
jgi:hypothetical protein